jgi:hypothetical protein
MSWSAPTQRRPGAGKALVKTVLKWAGEAAGAVVSGRRGDGEK